MVFQSNEGGAFDRAAGEFRYPSNASSDEFGESEGVVRILHASDLHLERVVSGLAEVPDHLRPTLADSSYAAARRVFEAAVAERVDAVLLAGDVVDLSLAGPRSIVFLREQFEALAAEGIKVFWAGGRVDPPCAWPKVSPLPANVHVFSSEHVETIEVRRNGELLACVAGISAGGAGDVRPLRAPFAPHEQGVLTIGVAYGQFSRADADQLTIPYLAAGGRHGCTSFAAADKSRLVHYPGATQGVSPDEAGPHGATLVTLEADGTIRTQPVATDVVRWETPLVEVEETTSVAELERRLVAQAEDLRASAGATDLLVRWRITGGGPLVQALRQDDARGRIVQPLRERFGHAAPSLWTADVDVRRDEELPPALFEEETILGDVLREVRKLRDEPAASLELASYLAGTDRTGPLSHRLLDLASERHELLLDETSDQCVALLSGPSGRTS